MKPAPKKKVTLNTEKIRTLSSADVVDAKGGNQWPKTKVALD